MTMVPWFPPRYKPESHPEATDLLHWSSQLHAALRDLQESDLLHATLPHLPQHPTAAAADREGVVRLRQTNLDDAEEV